MHDAASCREKAARFRALAVGSDKHSAEHLNLLAEEYEAEARRLEPPAEPPMPSAS
jgi:hypothetical protein